MRITNILRSPVCSFLIGLLIFSNLNLSFAATVALPKTGQTSCYDEHGSEIPCSGTGEDGEIRAGLPWPSPRFMDNGDGTITDNLTGLMWLKDADCFGEKKWQEALDSAANFNSNSADFQCQEYTAKYSDWLCPNVNELESLINLGEIDPEGYLSDHGFLNVSSYWSSTSTSTGYYAWVVSMQNGRVFYNGKISQVKYHVWPVRGPTLPPGQVWKTGQLKSYALGDDGDLQRGASWPEPRFADHGDGTVSDRMTNLMWLKDANCLRRRGDVWQDALDTVAEFNTNPNEYSCGEYSPSYEDWRLPNLIELRSLISYSGESPALPPGYPFERVHLSYYWSSTTYTYKGNWAWSVDIYRGSVSYDDKIEPWNDPVYVLPVRSNISYVNKNDSTCSGNLPCYTSIQDAINNAAPGALIRIGRGNYGEACVLDKSRSLTLQGGWDESFTIQAANTTFIKTPKVTRGSLTFQMLTIRP